MSRARAAWVALALLVPAACDRSTERPSASASPPVTAAPSSASATSPSASAATPNASEPIAPISSEAAGVHYLEVIAGGARSDDRLPMIVAIHGLGDRPESFVALLPLLRVPARVVLPRGLDSYGRGWSWFAFSRDASAEQLGSGIRNAADRLAAALDEIARRRPTAGKPVVMGFSQGGMLSFALAVHHPDTVAAAFPLSGMLPPPLRPTAAAPAGAPSVIAFHGDADDLVPIAPARETVSAMKARGWSAELREARGVGHTVPMETRMAVQELIEAAARREATRSP